MEGELRRNYALRLKSKEEKEKLLVSSFINLDIYIEWKNDF